MIICHFNIDRYFRTVSISLCMLHTSTFHRVNSLRRLINAVSREARHNYEYTYIVSSKWIQTLWANISNTCVVSVSSKINQFCRKNSKASTLEVRIFTVPWNLANKAKSKTTDECHRFKEMRSFVRTALDVVEIIIRVSQNHFLACLPFF